MEEAPKEEIVIDFRDTNSLLKEIIRELQAIRKNTKLVELELSVIKQLLKK